MVTFSNPRLRAVIEDWPLGGSKRGTATFEVHTDPKRGQRVSRTTTGKPRYTTYSTRWCIVDGSNGRTYLLSLSVAYVSISVMSADMQHCATTEELGFDHYVKPQDADQWRSLSILFHNAK